MIDVNQITSTLRGMPDQQLQQYAAMHKGDPYILSLAVAESNQRKQLRAAAQAQAAGQQLPKVADQDIAQMAPRPVMSGAGLPWQTEHGGHVQTELPENQGIGRLPAPNMQRMADGGIAGFDESSNSPMSRENMENMGNTGGMFNYAQDGGGVMRMASGGKVPGYANGVFNDATFREYLKSIGMTGSQFANADIGEKNKILAEFGKINSGPQMPPKAASTAAPQPSNSGAAYEAGKKYGPTVQKVGESLSKLKPSVGSGTAATGVLAALPAAYEGYSQGDFYNDPNVPALGKAKQALGTAAKVGIPMTTAGVGSLIGPWGTAGGTVAGGALTAYLDRNGMLNSQEYEDWLKAHPQAAAPAPAKNPAQATQDKAAVDAGKVTLPEAAPEKPGAAPAGMSAPAGVTAADIEKMYSQFAGTKEERAAKTQDIKNQLGSLVGSETLAAQNLYNQLQSDIAEQGQYGKDREAKLKAKEERLGKEEGQSGGLALLEAGLAMMAGTSQHAFANIGQGALAGTAAYRKSQERLADARDKLDDAYGRLEDVRFNQKNMNAKELRDAKSGIDKAVNTGLARLIDYGVKDLGMEREDAKNMLGSYTHLKQAEVTAAPHWATAAAQQKRYNQTDKERGDYIKLQNAVLANLQKDDNYRMADVATQARMKVNAMRQALELNPHLSPYAADLGFSKAPTGQVLELQ